MVYIFFKSICILTCVDDSDTYYLYSRRYVDGNEQHILHYLCTVKLCYDKDKHNLKYMPNNKNSE